MSFFSKNTQNKQKYLVIYKKSSNFAAENAKQTDKKQKIAYFDSQL